MAIFETTAILKKLLEIIIYRRTEAIAPDLSRPSQVIARDFPQVPDCFAYLFRRYAAGQPKLLIGYSRDQNNPGEMGV